MTKTVLITGAADGYRVLAMDLTRPDAFSISARFAGRQAAA